MKNKRIDKIKNNFSLYAYLKLFLYEKQKIPFAYSFAAKQQSSYLDFFKKIDRQIKKPEDKLSLLQMAELQEISYTNKQDNFTSKGYQFIHQFSDLTGFNANLVEKEGELYLLINGTNDKKDIFSDMAILGEKMPVQLNSAIEAVSIALKMGKPLTVLGHSLGGGLAQIIGSLYPIKTIAFNPLGAGDIITSQTLRENCCLNLTTVANKYDVISDNSPQLGHIKIVSSPPLTTFEAHKISTLRKILAGEKPAIDGEKDKKILATLKKAHQLFGWILNPELKATAQLFIKQFESSVDETRIREKDSFNYYHLEILTDKLNRDFSFHTLKNTINANSLKAN